MATRIHLAGVLLALCFQVLPAGAQNVYRCGGSYSTQPCPGAKVVTIDDSRSAAQKAQTDAAASRDAKSAQVMEKERLKQEALPAQATIPVAAAEPLPPVPEHSGVKARPKKPELFTAVQPRKAEDGAPSKKKKKAKKPVRA